MEGGTVQTSRTRKVYADIMQTTKAQSVFEIGFNQGKSTELFLENGARVHSVDIDRKCKEAMEKLDITFEIKSSSLCKAEDYEKFDLVFIDGGHTVSNLRNDLIFASKMKAPFILVDDYNRRSFPLIVDVVNSMVKYTIPYRIAEKYSYDATDGENIMVLLEKV